MQVSDIVAEFLRDKSLPSGFPEFPLGDGNDDMFATAIEDLLTATACAALISDGATIRGAPRSGRVHQPPHHLVYATPALSAASDVDFCAERGRSKGDDPVAFACGELPVDDELSYRSPAGVAFGTLTRYGVCAAFRPCEDGFDAVIGAAQCAALLKSVSNCILCCFRLPQWVLIVPEGPLKELGSEYSPLFATSIGFWFPSLVFVQARDQHRAKVSGPPSLLALMPLWRWDLRVLASRRTVV